MQVGRTSLELLVWWFGILRAGLRAHRMCFIVVNMQKYNYSGSQKRTLIYNTYICGYHDLQLLPYSEAIPE